MKENNKISVTDTMSGGPTEQTGGRYKFSGLIQKEVGTQVIRRQDSTTSISMGIVGQNRQGPVPEDQAVQITRQRDGRTNRVRQQRIKQYRITKQSGSQNT